MPRMAQGRASTVSLFVHLEVVCVGIHLVLKDAVGTVPCGELARAGGMFSRCGGPQMTALTGGETGCWHD